MVARVAELETALAAATGRAETAYPGVVMSTVHLPEELVDRLAVEAARRGISVDDLAAEALAARFPHTAPDTGGDALEAFIGSGDSGDPTWAGRDSAELRKDAATRRTG